MNSPEIALFLWINAGPHAPAAVVLLAKYASLYLPWLSMAALLMAAAVRPSLRAAAAQTLVALLLAWVAARLLRHGLAMPRPAAMGLGIQWIAHAGGPGLPSLHASGAFAVACSLFYARVPRAMMVAGVCVALLIGWSRLALGVHFPLDVICGAAVGLLSAQAAHFCLRNIFSPLRRNSRVNLLNPQGQSSFRAGEVHVSPLIPSGATAALRAGRLPTRRGRRQPGPGHAQA